MWLIWLTNKCEKISSFVKIATLFASVASIIQIEVIYFKSTLF